MRMKPPQQPPPDGKQPEPVIPTREVVTEYQIHSLLSVIQAFQPYLLVPHRDWTGEEPPKLDGGTHMAAASAFTVACQKLEDVMNQPKRWDTSTHDLLYDNIAKYQQAQIEFFQAQKRVAEKLERPSYNLQPELRLIEGGRYIATYGDTSVPGRAIIGMGDTPQAALDDFDKAFQRTPAEQLMGVIEEGPSVDNPPAVCETPPVPEEKPKRKRKSDTHE